MKISIALMSQGRAYEDGFTFDLLDKAQPDVPVFVYVHRQEYNVYKEQLSDMYTVVKHPYDYLQIREIRGFMQKHQYDLGNYCLVLDDDIVSLKFMEKGNTVVWDKSLANLFEEMACMETNGIDIMLFFGEWELSFYKTWLNGTTENKFAYPGTPWFPYVGTAYVWAPSLYDKGVRIAESAMDNEDAYLTVEPRLKGCNIRYFNCYHRNNEWANSKSHFNAEIYQRYNIQTYLHYGPIFLITRILGKDAPWNQDMLNLYKKHGCFYTPFCDSVLSKVLNDKSPGHLYLEEIGWTPAVEYDLELTVPIDKLFQAICNAPYHEDGAVPASEVSDEGIMYAPPLLSLEELGHLPKEKPDGYDIVAAVKELERTGVIAYEGCCCDQL